MRDRRLTDHPLFRLLVLALLSVPLVILVTTPRQQAARPDSLQDLTQQQVSEPDSYMTGLHLKRFNPEGRLQYEFHASRASHQANSQATILNEPRLLFVDTPDPWSMESNFGKLLGNGETVELWDNVDMRRGDGSLAIRTTAITLYPERDYAETDRAVTMDGIGTRTEAVGLQADLKASRMRLLSDVRSTHETQSR